MPKITYLDPEDTGATNWHGVSFRPNVATSVDASTHAALISAAAASPNFWKVTGLSGDDKEAADAAAEEAEEFAEREKAALQAEEDAAAEAAEAARAKSEEMTKPGAAEAAKHSQAAPQTKKPGAR
jgi:TRAP-type C4-dicarboxylate transport system substrate-binding protein